MRDRIQFRNQSHTKIVASFVSLLGREGSYDAESQPRALVPVLLAIRRKWGVGAEDKLVREGLMEAYSDNILCLQSHLATLCSLVPKPPC